MIQLDNKVHARKNGNSIRLYFWRSSTEKFGVYGSFYSFPYDFGFFLDLKQEFLWKETSQSFYYGDIEFVIQNGFDCFYIHARNENRKSSVSLSFESFFQREKTLNENIIHETLEYIKQSFQIADTIGQVK